MHYMNYIFTLVVLCFYLSEASKNKIYFIENSNLLNWNSADSECKSKGMHLVSIKTKDELEYLKEYIKNNYVRVFPYWLGAYKINGQFVWTTRGEKISQFFWHAGEPNNKSGQEKCIHTWDEDFDWNDNDCERELPFICDLEV